MNPYLLTLVSMDSLVSEASDSSQLLDHLFRYEAGKLISVLTKIFGPKNLELAEDVVQDTLLKALEHWKYHGVPDNPTAWLFTVARNKALDVIRRERYKKEFAEETSALLMSEYSTASTIARLINENEIQDEQLRMMFVCCHPNVAEEGQIALILKTLCGFSIAEIAKAFLTNDETITKRLYRAREQFRENTIRFEIPSATELNDRLENVLTTIYLLFNEGYHSTHHEELIREDLIEEALRLCLMLVDFPLTRKPQSLALMALLCLHASRLGGRTDESGNLLLLPNQKREKWNQHLIDKGKHFLNEASYGEYVSRYHLEAAIAYEHCKASEYAFTDWEKILQLYEWLYKLQPDGNVALNRAIVIAELEGPKAGLDVMDSIIDKCTLEKSYLWCAIKGDLMHKSGDCVSALFWWNEAMKVTKSPAEQKLLRDKIKEMVNKGK